MRQFIAKAAVIISLLAPATHGAAIGKGSDAAPGFATIYVRIYDYADVPAHILGQAKTHAARVFKRSGIEMVWLADPLHREASEVPATSTGPLDYERQFRELSLRIYPANMSQRLKMGETVFGYALQPEGEIGFGRIAIVFNEKAVSLAKLGIASQSVTLGHIIAHEMGHLLLGNNSHSQFGIMHVPWNRALLKAAATGRLNFTPEETQRIRKGLARRARIAALRAAAITN